MDGDDANVKVFCRVRPPNERERGVASSALSGSAGFLARSSAAAASALFAKKCVSVPSSDAAQQTLFLHSKHGPARTFTFDRVFGEQASQTDVFDVVGAPITQACLEGYNGTIFAYGQTGSGKTFTMQGPDDVIDAEARSLSPEQLALRGLVPRVIDYLFANATAQDGEKNVQHTFACSFLEIYNERVYDLLDGGSAKDAAGLQLRENGRKGVHVEGLIESVVANSKKAAELMTVGAQNRRVGQTSMNRESSRSHSVFILQLQSKEISPHGTKIRTSRFNLVDLAGSERQRSTDAAGERLKEAGGINKSLSALGNVILGLSEQSVGKHRHVHYRDSKLTFLLKDSLGGNSKTFMVATISPAEDSAFETLSTLKFAQRAKLIQNSAVVNEDSVGSALFLQEEVQRLRRQLQHAHQEIARSIPGSSLLLQEGSTPSEVASSQDSAAPATQQLGPCDPSIDGRFRELEESFATTAEKTDRLLRSCEYLQLQNGNFQALCAELKQNVAHLTMNLRLRGLGGSEAHDYEPSADAIEWRMKYEEMEERFAELQDELQRSGIEDAGLPGKINSEVESLNMMVLALTKQLAFVLRDKHDLQDRLLESQPGKDESMEGPSSQEVVDADFSARLQEALKQQANEYQAKLDSVGSVTLCLEAKAAETAFELLQIKEREASWAVHQHDLERQLVVSKAALQRSEEAQSTSHELLVQEKARVEGLELQLERAREGARLEFEAALADAATSNRDLERSKKLLQHQLAAVTAGLKQREHQVHEAERAFAQLKVEMKHLEEANQEAVQQLGEAREELKEATLQAARLRAEISDRDNEVDGLKRSKAAVTEEKQVLQHTLQESSKLIEQLEEEAEAAARSHAEAIESLKRQIQEEQKLVEAFEKQLHVKEERLQQLHVEIEDHRTKADEADRLHSSLLEEKEASLAALQRQLDDQQRQSKLALEDAEQQLSQARDALSQLSGEKERVESERICAVQEIERLREDAKKLQADKDAMASEIQRLSESVEQLEAKSSELGAQNAALQEKRDQSQAQLSESEETIKKLAQEVEGLQQRLAVLSKEAAGLRSDLASAKEESRQSAITQSQQLHELASSAKKIEELQRELGEVKADMSDKLEKAGGEIRDAEATVSHQQEEISMYKGIQSKLRDEVRKLEVDRLELTESLKTAQESKQDVEQTFADAQETWLDEKHELTQSSQEAISTLEKRVEELVLGGETLSAQKRELEHENESLKASISEHNKDLEALKEAVAVREDKIRALESSTAETQGQLAETVADLRSSVRGLERQVVEQQEAASKQETELAEKDSVIDALKERAHNGEAAWDVKAREHKAELEAAHGRVQAFEQLVAEKTAVLTSAEQAWTAEKRALEQKLEEGEEILAQQTEQLMQEIEQLGSAIKEKDTQLELASKSVAELKDRFERAAEDESNVKVKELQTAMDALGAKHKLVVAENARLKEKAVSELEEKEGELSRRRAEMDAAEEQLKSDRRSLERAALAAESAKKEAEAKSVTLDMLGQTKRKFLTEKVKLQREIQTLSKKLEAVSRENEKLVGHHNSRQKIQHHVKVKEENNRLIDQVRQLTEDKAKLQRSVEKMRKVLKEKENIGVEAPRNSPLSASPAANSSAATTLATKKVRRPSLGSASSATAASAARAAARLAERGRPLSRSASPGPTKKRVRTHSSSSGRGGWQR